MDDVASTEMNWITSGAVRWVAERAVRGGEERPRRRARAVRPRLAAVQALQERGAQAARGDVQHPLERAVIRGVHHRVGSGE